MLPGASRGAPPPRRTFKPSRRVSIPGVEDQFPIGRHVEEISARTHAEGQRLAGAFVLRAWPGGVGDRSERAALGWLKRWRPGAPKLEPLACGCSAGRCLVCN